MIISKTPFRISFFGGGTDYPAWFKEHGGCVLSASINKYCFINLRSLPPFFEHSIRVSWSRIENTNNIDDIVHPAVREGLRFMGIERGISISHEGDLPARTGLGSSSSFIVGLLHALNAYQGKMINKVALAKDAIYVEQEMIKDNVGCQDQIAAAVGGLNKIEFSAQGFNVSPLMLHRDVITQLEESILLFFTGISRTASEIVEAQLRDMGDKQKEMMRTMSITKEAETLLMSGDISGFGRLMNEAWQLKRTFSKKISNELIDEAYEAGIKSGACGGKLLGAGGGGFLLFICPPENQEKVKLSLSKFLHVPVKFEFNGTQIIYYTPDEVVSNNSAR